MGEESSAWLIYERCVAAFVSDTCGSVDTTVQPNVILQGEISGANRQIDVLVDYRWAGGISSRILVDAKVRSRPLDLGEVEQFEGMMRDCRAVRGIMICAAGWTTAAKRRAQEAITIEILDFQEAVDEYEWAYEACLSPCSKRRAKIQRGGVLWGEFLLEGYQCGPTTAEPGVSLAGWVLVQVGKCDGCHSFHVWCWDCGSKFAAQTEQLSHAVAMKGSGRVSPNRQNQGTWGSRNPSGYLCENMGTTRSPLIDDRSARSSRRPAVALKTP